MGFEYGIEKAVMCIKNEEQESKRVRDTKRRCQQFTNRGSDGLACIGFSEIDKYASAIYSCHYPEHKNYGDARGIIWEEVPDFELLVAGFPCQSFSIAGKRGGFEDIRGTLFFEIARCLSVKRPQLCLLENVKGLLSHDSGRTLETIFATLSDLGYVCEWQVLNSKNHGVPQNRERIFIVGHLGRITGQAVFPIDEGRRKNDKAIARTVNSSDWRGANRNQKQTTIMVKEVGVTYENKIRRLTPTEAERLQGFPDSWTEYGIMEGKKVKISDTQRYKCLGNAVTTNVITEIIKAILSSRIPS